MEKKNFYLTKQQIENLERKAAETGIKISELIRRIIDDFFSNDIGKRNAQNNFT